MDTYLPRKSRAENTTKQADQFIEDRVNIDDAWRAHTSLVLLFKQLLKSSDPITRLNAMKVIRASVTHLDCLLSNHDTKDSK